MYLHTYIYIILYLFYFKYHVVLFAMEVLDPRGYKGAGAQQKYGMRVPPGISVCLLAHMYFRTSLKKIYSNLDSQSLYDKSISQLSTCECQLLYFYCTSRCRGLVDKLSVCASLGSSPATTPMTFVKTNIKICLTRPRCVVNEYLVGNNYLKC